MQLFSKKLLQYRDTIVSIKAILHTGIQLYLLRPPAIQRCSCIQQYRETVVSTKASSVQGIQLYLFDLLHYGDAAVLFSPHVAQGDRFIFDPSCSIIIGLCFRILFAAQGYNNNFHSS
jgi:hypothetical protein